MIILTLSFFNNSFFEKTVEGSEIVQSWSHPSFEGLGDVIISKFYA